MSKSHPETKSVVRHLLTGLVGFVLVGFSQAQAQPVKHYKADEIIVSLKPGAPSDLHRKVSLSANNFNKGQKTALEKVSQIPGTDIQLWKAKGLLPERAVEALQNNPNIEFAEPNYIFEISETTPNDPKYGNQWGFSNMNAPQAWDIHTGSDAVVAVVDTGIQYTHPDLSNNIWVNVDEIPDNGKDDDNNGYIDDVYGYDFYNNDSDPIDDHSHGSHVAGTIAAESNNSTGVAGVNWSARVMALKICSGGGSCSMYAAAQAINYASQNGAKVSNHSYRTTSYSSTLQNAVDNAQAAGHLVVAAAGNDGKDIDANPVYPAAFSNDNIISVAAINSSNSKPSWSNWGAKNVDLGAPGYSIVSTNNSGGYTTKSGTSMASPHVAGAATLLFSYQPGLTYSKVKSALLNTVTATSSMSGKTVTGGRVNLGAAIGSLSSTITVADDSASTTEGQSVNIAVLNNDSTTSSGGLDISGVSQPSNGSVKINNLGNLDGSDTLTYTPNASYSGTESFSYTVVDSAGQKATAKVTISVSNVNDAPTALADSASTAVDTQVTIAALSNDTDPDGDGLDIVGVSTPNYGSASIQNNGSFNNTDAILYTPPQGFEGTASFSYTISDPSGAKSTASVSVNISGNLRVIAETGQISSLTEQAQVIQLQHTFTNPVVIALPPSFNGTQAANVRISNVKSNEFTVQIQEPNYLDGNHTTEDVSYIVVEAGRWLLPNGASLEAGLKSTYALSSGTFDTVQFSEAFSSAPAVLTQVQTVADASFVQTRQDNTGTSSFQLALEHEEARSTISRASETVGWVAFEKSSGSWDGQTYIAGNTGVAVTDATYSLSFSGFSQTPRFLASIATFRGADTANVRLSSISASGAKILIHEEQSADTEITHTQEDVAYLAISGSGVLKGEPVSTTDPDPDTTAPTVSITSPTNGATVSGTISVSAAASDDVSVAKVDFYIDGSYWTSDSSSPFGSSLDTTKMTNADHTISAIAVDSSGNKSSASQITVTVSNSTNSAPTASNDSAKTTEGTSVVVNVLANDSDPDGDALSISGLSQGTYGSTKLNSDGTITYSPQAGFSGSDAFNYQVSDGNGGTDTATVTVTVEAASAPLSADSMTPNSIRSGDYNTTFEIKGSGFKSGVTVDISGGSGPSPQIISVTVVDGSTLKVSATIKSGGPPRKRVHTVTVTNPDGKSDTVSGGLTILP